MEPERRTGFPTIAWKMQRGMACVKSGQGGTAVVPGITMRRSRIDALLGKLIRFAVSPVCARDVVEDWLAL